MMKIGFPLFTMAVLSSMAVADACVFPVSLFVGNKCSEFWKQTTTDIIADGECHSVPTGAYSPDVDPGPYYRATCDATGNMVQFVDAECTNPDCTNCAAYSSWIHGPSGGLFDMSKTECQGVIFTSFVSTGASGVANPPATPSPVATLPAPTLSPVAPAPITVAPVATLSPVTVAPVAPAPTLSPVAPVPTTVAPVAPAPTLSPVAPPVASTSAPVAERTEPTNNSTAAPMVEECTWGLRYFNLNPDTYKFGGCSVAGLIAPTQRAVILADGQCHDSGIASVGFYQAVCDPTAGLMFLKNKCFDATCAVCDADSDIYTGAAFQSGVCTTHDVSINEAWVLRGTCAASSCAGLLSPTTTPPTQSAEQTNPSTDTFSLLP